ncbi:MAG TPA: TetR/AcrR family transcriptional regulator [Acidobacteriota bacterium]|jgi:TetR/AcrR family fatty acid metabolism transcriptional regulator|nr:TetR/AcrR family transcriptional regulator [Acidobacteriota bacterium]
MQRLRTARASDLDSGRSAKGAARQPRTAGGSKYETILRAAIKVFARRGFFNSTVADIARQADVADGTVYLYFKNKDDILVSIFNHIMDEVLESIQREISPVRDPIEKLRLIVQKHLQCLGDDRDLAVVFQVELRHSTKFMEQFSATRVAQYLELIRKLIEQAQNEGRVRQDINPKIASKVLFGALDEMSTNWMLSRKKYLLRETAEPIFEIFLRGISGEAAIRNSKTEAQNRKSAIRNPQSAIRNSQSAIRGPQSAIRNPQSKIP